MSHTEPLFGFGLQQKKSLMEYLGELGASPEQAAAIAALVALTNNSGGTASNTVANIPLSTAAATGADTATLPTQASVLASLTALRNAVASNTAKINAIIAALKL